MCRFVKDNFVFKIILYILIINFSIYLTAFSKTNLNNFFSGDFSTNEFLARKFAKERQLWLCFTKLQYFYSFFYNPLFI